ncbi:hypothetical protein Ciccas_005892 [Cichlidogyrus casuarinus]|uniref:Uncharacterized protein n=1 Tax=Cichlidogyrus casuarinus TaxID=1844966 RepID=A0ABD2Q7F0_9PLAT
MAVKPAYTCKMHGRYRAHLEYLGNMKQWALALTIIMLIPITLALQAIGVTLGWLYQFMGVLVGSAVAPVSYTLLWEHITALGMVAGAVSGTISGLITLFVYASYLNDSGNVFANSNDIRVMLAGNCVSIGVGAILPIIITLITRRCGCSDNQNESSDQWEGTRDIDNPLRPWPEVYASEMKLLDATELGSGRPSLDKVTSRYKLWIKVSILASVILTLLYIIIWPGLGAIGQSFSLDGLKVWIYVMEIYVIVALTICVLFPIYGEWKKYSDMKEAEGVMNKININFTNMLNGTHLSSENKKNFKPYNFDVEDEDEQVTQTTLESVDTLTHFQQEQKRTGAQNMVKLLRVRKSVISLHDAS